MSILWALVFAACVLTVAPSAFCASFAIQSEPVHLRSGMKREWRSFPADARASTLSRAFESRANAREHSLLLRQRDVKAGWTVTLNDTILGDLIQDERDMLRVLAIPPGTLREGSNRLEIKSKPASFSDDIDIRDVRIEDVSVADLQRQSALDIAITSESGSLPVRITVVDKVGSLVPIRALRTEGREAIRTGVLYSSSGRSSIGLPAGEYRVYASRGFEYSAPSARVQLRNGQHSSVALKLRREVPMTGFVSCDTHVHTLELSGHGDASVEERLLTAAGEGLDLVVATEHNRLADYSPAIRKLDLNRWVAAISGSEITTALGHFNIFPLRPAVPVPNPAERDWTRLMGSVRNAEGVRVVIQNHPRDLHSNYRPFEPAHHISAIGENLESRPFLANALEVVNSGAMASDPLQLVRDWLGLLTRGPAVAIGASDTHTVDFVPIGQARTYIDVTAVPGWRKNLDSVAEQLAAGRNLVSYGLAADLQQAGPPESGAVPVSLTVWGPSWSAVDHVTIYSNGVPVWQKSLGAIRKPGRKFFATLRIPNPAHDTVLVAVATGPGVLEPFWEVRKPYQPTSDEWNPIVLGVSRALWIDSDRNGTRESSLNYAHRLLEKHGQDTLALVAGLAQYDSSVALHVLNLMRVAGLDIQSTSIQSAFLAAGAKIREAYQQYGAELSATSNPRTGK